MGKGLPISFRMDESDKLALEAAARAEARSVSSLLTVIVRQWLAAREAEKP